MRHPSKKDNGKRITLINSEDATRIISGTYINRDRSGSFEFKYLWNGKETDGVFMRDEWIVKNYN